MTVLDPGHKYQLHTLDGSVYDLLIFVKREGPGYPGNVGHYPGTNIQDVLRCCIERLKYLNGQIPCEYNIEVTRCLREAIRQLEVRAAERHGRSVDIFDYRNRTMSTIEEMPFCPGCGHIGCEGECCDSRAI